MGFSSIAGQRSASRSASVNLGFANPMCAVTRMTTLASPLCSSVNAGALAIVRVLVPAQPRSAISHPAKRVLMSQGYCFVIGSVSRCGFVTRCSATTTFEDLSLPDSNDDDTSSSRKLSTGMLHPLCATSSKFLRSLGQVPPLCFVFLFLVRIRLVTLITFPR